MGAWDLTGALGRVKMVGTLLVPIMIFCSLPEAWPTSPPERAALSPWQSQETLGGGVSHSHSSAPGSPAQGPQWWGTMQLHQAGNPGQTAAWIPYCPSSLPHSL
jgi:hypothetical protein